MTQANTSQVMMIRPVQFRYNEETAENNAFQVEPKQEIDAQQNAIKEFDTLVKQLQDKNIDVLIIDDTPDPDTPDSIFPNNWISTHSNGTIVLYPMFAENRRVEVRQDIIDLLIEKYHFSQISDWTQFADTNRFLEGTGSIAIDRANNVAYACLSDRTDKQLALDWGESMGYEMVLFDAVDETNFPIYHTNVMMAVCEAFAIVCMESIPTEQERNLVKHSLLKANKEVIEISYSQMNNFAGNMIELRNKNGEYFLVMSQAARDSLTEEQITKIEKYAEIISSPIPTIEKNGGGSVRCMIAEIYPPQNI